VKYLRRLLYVILIVLLQFLLKAASSLVVSAAVASALGIVRRTDVAHWNVVVAGVGCPNRGHILLFGISIGWWFLVLKVGLGRPDCSNLRSKFVHLTKTFVERVFDVLRDVFVHLRLHSPSLHDFT